MILRIFSLKCFAGSFDMSLRRSEKDETLIKTNGAIGLTDAGNFVFSPRCRCWS